MWFYNIKYTVRSMLQIDKKKRNHSGSRSKSKKYRGYQYSVDLRNKVSQHEHTKVKTENSSSLNRSRPSRKNSTKQKKHTKSNNKDSKEPISHSVSADRRHSIMKVNRTEAHFEQEGQVAIDHLLMGLRSIPQPPCANARLLNQYFNDLKRYFAGLQGPFHRLCLELHGFYIGPMQKFLELVSPMEEAIRRKQQIAKEIDRQVSQNEGLYAQLQPIDIQIFKLKEKIEENRALIEQKRLQKQSRSKEKQSTPEQPHVHFEIEQPPEPEPEREAVVEQHVGKGFKLNLDNIGKLGHMSYQEEFESKIDEFSESWRNQALREKRC